MTDDAWFTPGLPPEALAARGEILRILEARGLGPDRAQDLLADIQDAGAFWFDTMAADSVTYEADKRARRKSPGSVNAPRRKVTRERNAVWSSALGAWQAAGLPIDGFDGRLGAPDDLQRFLRSCAVWAGFDGSPGSADTIRVFVGEWKARRTV